MRKITKFSLSLACLTTVTAGVSAAVFAANKYNSSEITTSKTLSFAYKNPSRFYMVTDSEAVDRAMKGYEIKVGIPTESGKYKDFPIGSSSPIDVFPSNIWIEFKGTRKEDVKDVLFVLQGLEPDLTNGNLKVLYSFKKNNEESDVKEYIIKGFKKTSTNEQLKEDDITRKIEQLRVEFNNSRTNSEERKEKFISIQALNKVLADSKGSNWNYNEVSKEDNLVATDVNGNSNDNAAFKEVKKIASDLNKDINSHKSNDGSSLSKHGFNKTISKMNALKSGFSSPVAKVATQQKISALIKEFKLIEDTVPNYNNNSIWIWVVLGIGVLFTGIFVWLLIMAILRKHRA
ncbi:hypothetical protein [Mycoplasma elephantis]|uniref:hypothetical protein n=1 Tax=Mycoplasma elephantis TaxID=114882 RepID=UPI000488A5C0|nr:hypothetical protein [Mycoplasma elephantis]